jgi:hypothetical protein
MIPGRQLERPKAVVDCWGFPLRDPAGAVIGRPGIYVDRMLSAVRTQANGGLSRRYTPSHAPGDQMIYAMDFSLVIPRGTGLTAASVQVWRNTVAPVLASSTTAGTEDWTTGAVSWWDRIAYAELSGGVDGSDYQVRWSATDTNGNLWTRTALVLCSESS